MGLICLWGAVQTTDDSVKLDVELVNLSQYHTGEYFIFHLVITMAQCIFNAIELFVEAAYTGNNIANIIATTEATGTAASIRSRRGGRRFYCRHFCPSFDITSTVIYVLSSAYVTSGKLPSRFNLSLPTVTPRLSVEYPKTTKIL